VALLLTLRDGGARLISTGNLNTTQPDAVDRLRAEGVTVIGEPTKDAGVHAGHLREVLAAEPDLILDNGGDLFAGYLDRSYPGLRGGTEETTSGRMRLEPLRGQLGRPILVINDSPIKQFAENEHAVGQSAVESFLRMTNRVTNGEQVTVFGYGACGRGVAASFRGAYARVSVSRWSSATAGGSTCWPAGTCSTWPARGRGELDRIDGPRLRSPGPLPGGGRPRRRGRHQLRGPGARRHRRGRRPKLPGPEIPCLIKPGKLLAPREGPAHTSERHGPARDAVAWPPGRQRSCGP
jgi:hypothetical protein